MISCECQDAVSKVSQDDLAHGMPRRHGGLAGALKVFSDCFDVCGRYACLLSWLGHCGPLSAWDGYPV